MSQLEQIQEEFKLRKRSITQFTIYFQKSVATTSLLHSEWHLCQVKPGEVNIFAGSFVQVRNGSLSVVSRPAAVSITWEFVRDAGSQATSPDQLNQKLGLLVGAIWHESKTHHSLRKTMVEDRVTASEVIWFAPLIVPDRVTQQLRAGFSV